LKTDSIIGSYIEHHIEFLKEHDNEKIEKGYKSIYHFLKKEAIEFNTDGMSLTEDGIMKECYKNTYDLCSTKKDIYIYTEGYVTSSIGFPVLHAWITTENGKIIDPTLRIRNANKSIEYFGVQFNFDYVTETIIEKETYGIIDNYEMGFPILTGEHEKKYWKFKKT